MSKTETGEYQLAVLNSLVRQTSGSWLSLNTNAKRLLFYVVSHAIDDQENDDKLPCEVVVPCARLAHDFGVALNNIYDDMKQGARDLRNKDVVFKNPKTGRTVECGWLSSQEYEDGEGYLTVSFDPKIKPVLKGLKGHFTLMNYLSAGKLIGHSARLYELLCSYKSLKVWNPEIEEFREMMAIEKSAYRTKSDLHCTKDFNRYVISPCVDKINEVTELNVGYERGNYGRTWRKIKFTILEKTKDAEATMKQAEKPSDFDLWWDNWSKIQKRSDLCELYMNLHKKGRDDFRINAIYDNPKSLTESERRELFDFYKQPNFSM